jgi:hypothetical protein
MGTRMETSWERGLKLQFPYPRMAMEATTMRPCLLERLKAKLRFQTKETLWEQGRKLEFP